MSPFALSDLGPQFPLAPNQTAISAPIDVLTTVYQGRGEVNAALSESPTRFLGSPGSGGGDTVPEEWRVPAVYVDGVMFTRLSVSLQFRWVFTWAGGERFQDSGKMLPVRSRLGAPASPVRKAHYLQAVRIPSPWFRVLLTNEDAVFPLGLDAFEVHLFLRGT